MLQQTQVSRVLEYYPRFLARFPTLDALAAARPTAVREAWDGLGYYARARNLHALARAVVRRPDRALPPEPAELIKLPGVGRYTAGAIATFAYERAVAAVDTNVRRVIVRYFLGSRERGAGSRKSGSRKQGAGSRESGSTKQGAGSRKTQRSNGSLLPAPSSRDIWRLAEALVPRSGSRAWEFNQALMELGALVCTARRPTCGECPVRQGCRTGSRVVPG
jgi:A/G-specific adenine glycosylase